MEKPINMHAVLFDFDGTLSDTEPFGNRLNLEAFATFGVAATEEDLFSLVGTNGKESVDAVFQKYGLPYTWKDFWKIRPESGVIYRTMPITAFDGAHDLLVSLRARGIKTAVASNSRTCNIVYALDRLGLAGLFDAVVGGDMVENLKPAPDIFNLALSFLGVAPENAVVIDDSPSGIASAGIAGIYSVGFKGGSVEQDVGAADETISTYVGFDL